MDSMALGGYTHPRRHTAGKRKNGPKMDCIAPARYTHTRRHTARHRKNSPKMDCIAPARCTHTPTDTPSASGRTAPKCTALRFRVAHTHTPRHTPFARTKGHLSSNPISN